ncbi:MAG TPA: hypothetical protein VFM18_14755 [Methanosarcina sp.]|nr:hypothetical protein [Methanosarcina sp.]
MSYPKLLASVSKASQNIRTVISLIPNQNESDQKFKGFSSIIHNLGVAKAYRFEVEISAPPFMTGGSNALETSETIKTINLLAESAQIPEFVLATQQIHDAGQTREFVYDKIYPPVVMTFVCDGDMVVKEFFDKWAMGVLKTETGSYRYRENYIIPELIIKQLSDSGKEIYRVTLHDAYPKLVNDIVLSSSTNGFNHCQVQFVYRTWNSFRIENQQPKPDQIKDIMEKGFSVANTAGLVKNAAQNITKLL